MVKGPTTPGAGAQAPLDIAASSLEQHLVPTQILAWGHLNHWGLFWQRFMSLCGTQELQTTPRLAPHSFNAAFQSFSLCSPLALILPTLSSCPHIGFLHKETIEYSAFSQEASVRGDGGKVLPCIGGSGAAPGKGPTFYMDH